MGPAGFRRRGRRRGLVVGAAVGTAAARHRGSSADDAPAHDSSELDELEKLAEFRDKGVLTEEEFQAQKKQLLGG